MNKFTFNNLTDFEPEKKPLSSMDIVRQRKYIEKTLRKFASVSDEISDDTQGIPMENIKVIYSDEDIINRVDPLSDINWYKVKFLENGNANFYLNPLAKDLNIDLYVYEITAYNQRKQLAYSNRVTGKHELVTVPVKANKEYYIRVQYICGGKSDGNNYHFRCKNYTNTTINYAQIIQSDEDVFSRVDTSSNIKWYKVKFLENGKANFYLNPFSENLNIDLGIYEIIDINNRKQLGSSDREAGKHELVSVSVKSNTEYYISVEYVSGSTSDGNNFHLRCKNYPNTNIEQAQIVLSDEDILGRVDFSSDMDWYKVKFAESGDANFYLNPLTENLNIDLLVYEITDSMEQKELATSNKDAGEYELVSISVKAETEYYVCVKYVSGTTFDGSNYHFRCKNYPYSSADNIPTEYKEYIEQLSEAHENWIFEFYDAGISLEDFIQKEWAVNYPTPKTDMDCFKEKDSAIINQRREYGLTDGNFFLSNKDGISFFINPLNFLNDGEVGYGTSDGLSYNDCGIYQFMQLSFDEKACSQEDVKGMLVNTYFDIDIDEYGTWFFEASKRYGVNPYMLVSKALVEGGASNKDNPSALITGYNYNGTIIYNFFGIGATDGNALENGAKYAYDKGWTTPKAAIEGGAEFVSGDYISNGQDTFYTFRYNLPDFIRSGKITHQYASNIADAWSKGKVLSRQRSVLDNQKLKFKIPRFGDTSGDSNANNLEYSMGTEEERLKYIYGKEAKLWNDGIYLKESEALPNMETFSVKIWKYNEVTGTKSSSTKTITAHKKVVEVIKKIFEEIYNDTEKFPIDWDTGAYNWRGDGVKSLHSQGLAIDINWEKNAMFENDGTPLTGGIYDPGNNIYSIPANSSVVRAFKKYGWYWGGEWSSKKDYMHFAYLNY